MPISGNRPSSLLVEPLNREYPFFPGRYTNKTNLAVNQNRTLLSLTTIYTSTGNCHQHKIQVNFRSILTIVQQTSQGVGKLKVADGNVNRHKLPHLSFHRSIAGDFTCRLEGVQLMPDLAAALWKLDRDRPKLGNLHFWQIERS